MKTAVKFAAAVSLCAGAYAAYKCGPFLASTFWGGEPNAALYGNLMACSICYVICYTVLTRGDPENLFIIGFAALMTYLFAIPVGYRFAGMHDNGGAALYGGIIMITISPILGFLFVWPVARRVYEDGISRFSSGIDWAMRLRQQPANRIPVDGIDQAIRDGMVVEHAAKIDRDFSYPDQGRTLKGRVRASFTLKRNTITMPPGDCMAVNILYVLKQHGALSPAVADNMEFALAWGDGRGQMENESFNIPAAIAKYHGLHTLRDLASNEAGFRKVSVDGAIGELFTRLQIAAKAENAALEIIKLYDRLRPK